MGKDGEVVRPHATIHMRRVSSPIPVVDGYHETVKEWLRCQDENEKTMSITLVTDGDAMQGELLVENIEFIFEITPEVWRKKQESDIEMEQTRTEFEESARSMLHRARGGGHDEEAA